MGACGCGDGFGDFKFPGPDGSVYTVQFYPGCEYCDGPAGIVLNRYTGKDDGIGRAVAEDCPDVP